MSVALKVFERLTEAGEDPARAKAIAEGFEELEEGPPRLRDAATQDQLRETELRLLKEIKEVEAKLTRELKEVEAKLTREIKEIDARMSEVEARLLKEIKEIDARLTRDIEQTRREIRELEVRLTQAIHRQTLWVIGSVGAVVGFIRLLEWFLGRLA